MIRIKTIALALSGCAATAAGTLFAATLQVGRPSVVLMAGHKVEIPLSSSLPMAGDLAAKGAFEPGDVTFTDGPGCHLSAHNCTLMITAAPTSKSYTAVPVVVSVSSATNTPVFALSVIRPGESAPVNPKLPEIDSTPLRLSSELGSVVTVAVTNTTQHTLSNLTAFDLPSGVNGSTCPPVEPGATCTLGLTVNDRTPAGYFVIRIQSDRGLLQYRILSVVAPTVPAVAATPAVKRAEEPVQRSGNALFYGVAQPHPGIEATGKRLGHFTPYTNGPSYQIVELTNHDVAQSLSVAITGSGASYFTLDDTASHYGANKKCASMSRIASGESCLVIIKGEVGDPREAPQTATLTLRGGNRNVASFTLIDTTYVYAAGGFDTLGDANVSGGDLLAQCTAGTCSNALQGSTGNNYASSNFSVGAWINALAITPAGNIMAGGVFGAIGGATSGASSGTAALLAQCTPGIVVGNACINQLNGASNNYTFNNAYINGITAPFLINATNFMAVGGDFASIRGFTVSSGRMLAKVVYNGTSATPTGNSYMTTGGSTPTKYADKAISAVDTLGSTGANTLVHTGGMFTQIAGYPTVAPVSGTTFASCTATGGGTCSQSMDANNPNNSILGMTNDGTNLYVGGVFTQIGGYTSNGGYPLVSCTPAATTTCANALSGTNEANNQIAGMIYSSGNLYVGGKFTTIGGATPAGGPMLAVCTPGGTCSNFVTDADPYASGDDWGGMISGLTVGTQTGITAN